MSRAVCQFAFDPPAGAASVEQIPVNAWYDPALRLVVDCGYAAEPFWQDELGPVEAVVITHHHPDHDGGLAALVGRFPEAVLHVPDPERLDRNLRAKARRIDGRPLFEGRIEPLATPGHCDPHWSLWQPAIRRLYAGDLVLGEGTPWVGPPEGDMADWLMSLRRVEALQPQEIMPGHGPVCGPGQLAWTRQHREARIDEVAVILARIGPATPARLVDEIYVAAGMQLQGAHRLVAEITMEGYLRVLEAEGRVRRTAGGWLAG